LKTPSRIPNRSQIQEGLAALFRLDDEAAGELLLIRHARPADNQSEESDREPIHDPMLSCDGLRQAELLADRLSSLWIDTIYTAPERRCFQTAKVVADLLQRPVNVIEGLEEIGFKPEEACPAVESYSKRFRRQPRWESLPGFADGQGFRRRVVGTIEGIIAAQPARRSVVITHSSVINAYLSMVLCIPRDQFFAPDYTSISTVRHREDMYGVRGLNDTAHLDASELVGAIPPAFTLRSLPLTNR
jgi:2,3-bisphosphoglycerate-dependent phosphoglycerate mutase